MKEMEDLSLGTSTAETASAAEYLLISRNTAAKAISHLPIPPPEWCRLPSDELPSIIFSGGQNLPSHFELDDNSRCSCGENNSSEAFTVSKLTIYTSVAAIDKTIETRYCSSCANTKGRIGPDLGKHGLLNWNNRIAFSHELMNSYTAQFTQSPTPIYAFHRTTMRNYLCEDSPPFCSLQTFLNAWFAFVELQAIDSKMQCIQCGPNPPVVIADGISVAFAKNRVESLTPPTVSNKSVAHFKLPRQSTRTTCFTGPVKIRKAIQKALDDEDASVGIGAVINILTSQVNFLGKALSGVTPGYKTHCLSLPYNNSAN